MNARYASDGPWPRHLAATVVVPAILSIAACATLAREPWVLDRGSMQAAPVVRAAWVATWPQALATVLDVVEREWRFPRLDVRLVFLPDDGTFERLLVDIGYPPALARSTTDSMSAIGGHRRVLINERKLAEAEWPARVGLLAHELTHVVQYELGGGTRGQSDQWLREGFADWIETGVLATLGAAKASEVRAEATRRLRGSPASRYPPLRELATFPDWVAQNRDRRGADLYGQAAMAVAILVDRHGVDQVLDYFTRFAIRQDRDANFEAAFGETLADFDRAFRAHLWPSAEG